ncbi:MAG: glycosyltransferase [Micrococcaceae bacterium]
MRILHVVESFAGGVYSAVKTLANEQAKHGVQVAVCYSVRPDTLSEAKINSELIDVELFRFENKASSPKHMPGFAKFLRETIKNTKPEVVHIHSTFAGFVGRLSLRRNSKYKVFYTPHGWSFLMQDKSEKARKVFQIIETVLARKCDGVICVSESEAELAKTKLKAKKVTVLHNVVDVHKLPAKDYQKSVEKPVIGIVARVTYAKAPWKWQKIAELLKEEAKFYWVGERDTSDGWISGNAIEFTGWQTGDEIVGKIPNMDIYLSTSLWEGLPVAVIEAQGVGLPAVVTDITGNRDVVEDKVTGFVCKDIDETIEKLRLLIKDSKLRIKMGQAAVERVKIEFNQDNLYAKSMEAYKSF